MVLKKMISRLRKHHKVPFYEVENLDFEQVKELAKNDKKLTKLMNKYIKIDNKREVKK